MKLEIGVDSYDRKVLMVHHEGEPFAFTRSKTNAELIVQRCSENDDVIEPSNAEYILSAIRTDAEYALKQVRFAIANHNAPRMSVDALGRAEDALLRVLGNLTTTTVLPSE